MLFAPSRRRPARSSSLPTTEGERRVRRGLAALLPSLALVAGLLVAPAAVADEYPTWADVEAAKGDTTAAAIEVERITGLIADLQSEVAAAQALSEERGAAYFTAQEAYDIAAQRADDLAGRAAESREQAESASKQAGLLAAQLYRTTGTDLSVNIFLDGQGGQADELLSKIGNMTKLVERSSDIYAEAETATNESTSLGEQAEVARTARESRRVAAEEALAEATAAQQASEQALSTQESQNIVLEQQLAALRDTESRTIAEYQAGVAAREAELARQRAEEEAAREAARVAEIARRAAEAAVRSSESAPVASRLSAARPSVVPPSVSPSGWVRPAAGSITGSFGPRSSFSTGGGSTQSYHRGTDLAGGCGIPIYAANSGTVSYAGPFGTYGNWILLENGDGISTGYAHIMPGGIYVNVGDTVQAGEQIAAVGTTGASTGCHLHFETRVNGTAVDPQSFMAARGVTLG